ncbi:hypothetical protein YO48_003030 [Campylobacter jejuni]|nr:hypothetical protein YO48_003030 [Campylobacter jejuni]
MKIDNTLKELSQYTKINTDNTQKEKETKDTQKLDSAVEVTISKEAKEKSSKQLQSKNKKKLFFTKLILKYLF